MFGYANMLTWSKKGCHDLVSQQKIKTMLIDFGIVFTCTMWSKMSINIMRRVATGCFDMYQKLVFKFKIKSSGNAYEKKKFDVKVSLRFISKNQFASNWFMRLVKNHFFLRWENVPLHMDDSLLWTNAPFHFLIHFDECSQWNFYIYFDH